MNDPHVTAVPDTDWPHRDLEAIFAPGGKVRFAHPLNGRESDQEQAASLLTPGQVYTVAAADIGAFRTRVVLAGVDGGPFNSVLFDPVEDGDG